MTMLRFLARTFRACSAGNLGMVAAITFPILLGGAGLAFDYMRLVNEQRVLQDALDSAAVSAAASLVGGHHDATSVEAYAFNLVVASVGNALGSTEKTELKKNLVVKVTATSSSSKKSYDIKLSGRFNVALSPFSRFLGFTTRPVAGVSATKSEATTKNALSMYVVFDRSGSMSFVTDTLSTTKTKCQNYTVSNWGYYPYLASISPCYINKMGALKTAAASLFDELDTLEKKESSDTIIRVGGVSFTDAMQTPDAISWGTSGIRTYVNSFPSYPTGGTDMTDGMEQAYNSLNSTTEPTEHTKKGNATFLKFIVLMTDGENTGASTVWNPALDTETLATCAAARNAGITIFTVAFMAPPNGRSLLENCSGTTSNSYVADDMPSLVKAFEAIGNKAVAKATRIVN